MQSKACIERSPSYEKRYAVTDGQPMMRRVQASARHIDQNLGLSVDKGPLVLARNKARDFSDAI